MQSMDLRTKEFCTLLSNTARFMLVLQNNLSIIADTALVFPCALWNLVDKQNTDKKIIQQFFPWSTSFWCMGWCT